MLNVLSIVPYNFLPSKMGGQKCIAFGNKFLSQYVNLTCVTVANNDVTKADYDVLNILSNSQLRYINIFYFFKLKEIIRQKKITHIIIEHPYYGWLGYLIKKICRVKLIVRSHNIEALRFKSINKWWWKILWHYEKFVHKNADMSFFITNFDNDYAVSNFHLKASQCSVITYGFDLKAAPSKDEKLISKKCIYKQYNLINNETILFFNGTLSYKPNIDALNVILETINPILLKNSALKYKIIVCGQNLPESYDNLKSYKVKNIIYAGFVEDIATYFKATDIFLNPVIEGGGIKTKIVEALGNNASLVTTKSGAIGIPINLTANKMIVVEDNDWQQFTQAILEVDIHQRISTSYFDYFYWGNIAKKASMALELI